MKDFFNPEDFETAVTYHKDSSLPNRAYAMAAIANAKLQKLIESWPVVYAGDESSRSLDIWDRNKRLNDTHQARLAFIEEIPKPECKHEPDAKSSPRLGYVCKHCGVELEATWKPKLEIMLDGSPMYPNSKKGVAKKMGVDGLGFDK